MSGKLPIPSAGDRDPMGELLEFGVFLDRVADAFAAEA
jgi:hypothetical protein